MRVTGFYLFEVLTASNATYGLNTFFALFLATCCKTKSKNAEQ